MQCDLAGVEETGHSLIKIALEATVDGETDISHGDHCMEFRLCLVVVIREDCVQATHEVIGVILHVAFKEVREVAHETAGKPPAVFIIEVDNAVDEIVAYLRKKCFKISLEDNNEGMNDEESAIDDLAIGVEQCRHETHDVGGKILVDLCPQVDDQDLDQASEKALEVFLLIVGEAQREGIGIKRVSEFLEHGHQELSQLGLKILDVAVFSDVIDHV